jgi:TonB family protein
MTEDWTKQWERRIVNGVYPLRRFLGRSNHSVVFLTECAAQNVPQAAIKIMPANPAVTEAQLAHWKTVAGLSHPHLIRLLDSGRCQLGGHDFLFVVTDLAEQNLAQILPGRALTPGEVTDLLPPTLDALAYLHGKNLVHGGLKPPNFLVVDDQLKLASDAIRPAGERSATTAKASVYDPPEVKKSRMSTAGDLWGLGITLVEALTQAPPAWSRESTDGVPLPTNLAPEFRDIVHRCLNRDPARRPAITELAAQLNRPPPTPPPAAPASTPTPPARTPATPPAPAPSAPPSLATAAARPPSTPTFSPAAAHPAASPPSAASPAMSDSSAPPDSLQSQPKSRLPLAVIALGLVAIGAIWTGRHLFHSQNDINQTTPLTSTSTSTSTSTPTSTPTPTPAAPPSPPVSAPPVAQSPTAGIASSTPMVLHQENPDISSSARQTIRGVIKIAVRVNVDRSGNVVVATLASHASSKYFARAALDAAKKWKFSPAADPASAAWLLHFEFTHAGATAHAAALR